MPQPETTLIKVDGDDVTVTAESHVIFRVLKALGNDGRTIEYRERGKWTPLAETKKAA